MRMRMDTAAGSKLKAKQTHHLGYFPLHLFHEGTCCCICAQQLHLHQAPTSTQCFISTRPNKRILLLTCSIGLFQTAQFTDEPHRSPPPPPPTHSHTALPAVRQAQLSAA